MVLRRNRDVPNVTTSPLFYSYAPGKMPRVFSESIHPSPQALVHVNMMHPENDVRRRMPGHVTGTRSDRDDIH